MPDLPKWLGIGTSDDGPPKPDFPPQLNGSNWEIRLLILSPAAEHTAPLVGSFKVVSLHEHARYDATSHAWDMPGPPWIIVIDQHRYYITMSLARCLMSLRHKSGKRALWVDAICVDQKSDEERSQQVAFMQHTFSEARCVQVWLGYNSTRSARSVASINNFAAQKSETIAAKTTQERYEELDDLHALLTEPEYWDRLWIRQELALARSIEIVYGDISMPMKDFQQYLQICTSDHGPTAEVQDSEDNSSTRVLRNNQLKDLTQLLRNPLRCR